MSKQVLLIHGGYTGAWEWDGVIARLKQRGVEATAIDMPSREAGHTLADDEQAVRQALEGLESPVILVGHSYSGAVITAASAGNRAVDHLVYVAAVLPTEGQSVSSALQDEVQAEVPAPANPEDDWDGIAPDAARAGLYNDATDEQFDSVRPLLGKLSHRVFTEVPSGLGWKEHPSTYVICTLDQAFPLEVQQRFASNTTHSVQIEAGHSPMLTKPGEVAQVIADLAEA